MHQREQALLTGYLPDSQRSQPHQQYLTLGVSANPTGLKVAEAKAKEIAALIDLGRFDWSPYIMQKKTVVGVAEAVMVADWLKRFEQNYFESRPRTSAKLNTFHKNYRVLLARMPGHQELTTQLLRDCFARSCGRLSEPSTVCHVLWCFSKVGRDCSRSETVTL